MYFSANCALTTELASTGSHGDTQAAMQSAFKKVRFGTNAYMKAAEISQAMVITSSTSVLRDFQAFLR